MSISIFTPQTGERIGPGYPLNVTTDLVGPIPNTAFWQVIIRATAPGTNEGFALSQQISAFAGQHNLQYVIGNPTIPLQPQDGVQVNLGAGDAAMLVVQLTDNALVLDSTAQGQVWDPTGRAFALQQMGGAGLTAQQNTWLQQAGEGILSTFTDALGRLVSFPLGQYFLGTPPPQFVVRSPAPFAMVGEFDIAVPIGTYGLIWTFTFVPIGIGYNPGIPRLYHAEMVTLSEFHLDPGTSEFAINRVVSGMEGVPYQFVQPQPTKLHIEVLPGVTASGQWLILPSP